MSKLGQHDVTKLSDMVLDNTVLSYSSWWCVSAAVIHNWELQLLERPVALMRHGTVV